MIFDDLPEERETKKVYYYVYMYYSRAENHPFQYCKAYDIKTEEEVKMYIYGQQLYIDMEYYDIHYKYNFKFNCVGASRDYIPLEEEPEEIQIKHKKPSISYTFSVDDDVFDPTVRMERQAISAAQLIYEAGQAGVNRPAENDPFVALGHALARAQRIDPPVARMRNMIDHNRQQNILRQRYHNRMNRF